jgi:predicted MFS family arabinose efflux permease
MLTRRLKRQVFLLEWLNICAVAYYFNYLFFLTRDRYGFTNAENLLLAAINGFFYIIAAWLGGKFAQKHGCFLSLKVGFSVMLLALAAGSFFASAPALYPVMIVWTFGTCFTWPALEALAAENETRPGLCRMIGLYNLTWASGAAVAYFTGGALLQYLGQQSLYYVPMALHAAQLVILLVLEKNVDKTTAARSENPPVSQEPVLHPVPAATGRAFLSMAWLANPFAYVAMNTIIPLLPDLAARFQLSTELAGFVGSVWMFARLAAFFILWRWEGWHYRFNWLVGSFLAMIASFSALLLIPSLAVVVISQIAFGFAVGLIYYSSLFYSMEVGSTKGEHGGFHEALIGVGLCVGPAMGAASLKLGPHIPHVGAITVCILLVLGFGGLVKIRLRGDSSNPGSDKDRDHAHTSVSAK